MSINLDNVKAITHNSKDVIKIEDSNGNTIWQKPQVDKLIYRLQTTNSVVLNTRTLEFTKFNSGNNGRTSQGNAWTDGTDVFYSDGSLQRKIDFDGTSTSTSSVTWSGVSDMVGNGTFTDGTDVFYSSSDINSVYKLTKGTSTWSSYTFGGTSSSYSSSNIFRFNGVTYCSLDSNHIKYLNNGSWAFKRNVQGTVTTISGQYFWSPDDIHLFYTDGTNNWKMNTSDFSYSNSYWSGATASSTSVKNMFMFGSNTYVVQGTTGNYTIYQLDLTSLDSSTLVWTDVTSQFTIPSDVTISGYWIDEGGYASPICGLGVKAKDFTSV